MSVGIYGNLFRLYTWKHCYLRPRPNTLVIILCPAVLPLLLEQSTLVRLYSGGSSSLEGVLGFKKKKKSQIAKSHDWVIQVIKVKASFGSETRAPFIWSLGQQVQTGE